MSELDHTNAANVISAQMRTFIMNGVTIRSFKLERVRFVALVDVSRVAGIPITRALKAVRADDKITLLRSDTAAKTQGIWDHFSARALTVVLVTENGVEDLFRAFLPGDQQFRDWFRPSESPFDAIRRIRPDGTEFWSARELMPLMGYSNWQHFQVPLNRAMQVAKNKNSALTSNFVRSRKVSSTRGPAQEDVELTRFAAYLVAMNGDPNKSEVQAAQTYFAVKTRQAELAPALSERLTDDEIVHRALEITAKRVEALTARVEVLTDRVEEMEPKERAYELFLDHRQFIDLGVVSDMLGWGANLLRAQMRRVGILKNGGVHHNLPYARYEHKFKVVPWTKSTGGDPVTGYHALLDPNDVDWISQMVGSFSERPANLMKTDRAARIGMG